MMKWSRFQGISRSALALAIGVAAALPAKSALAADVEAGRVLALQWCASCHLVSNDQTTTSSTSLPSFFDMAMDPSWDAGKLATFLANPHPQMPDMTLGNIEIANLAGYIRSLDAN